MRRAAARPTGKPGADGASNLFAFQYLDDTRAISEQIDASRAAVAIGGSFIAYELAEAFASRGMETHWLMRGPRGLHRVIDEEAGALLHEAATADGVHMHYGEEVEEFVRSNGVDCESSDDERRGDCRGMLCVRFWTGNEHRALRRFGYPHQ